MVEGAKSAEVLRLRSMIRKRIMLLRSGWQEIRKRIILLRSGWQERKASTRGTTSTTTLRCPCRALLRPSRCWWWPSFQT